MIPSLEVFVIDLVNCDVLLEELLSCEAGVMYDWDGAGC